MTRKAKTWLKVKGGKDEILEVFYTEFNAEFIDRSAIFLATKLTKLQLIEVEKC